MMTRFETTRIIWLCKTACKKISRSDYQNWLLLKEIIVVVKDVEDLYQCEEKLAEFVKI